MISITPLLNKGSSMKRPYLLSYYKKIIYQSVFNPIYILLFYGHFALTLILSHPALKPHYLFLLYATQRVRNVHFQIQLAHDPYRFPF